MAGLLPSDARGVAADTLLTAAASSRASSQLHQLRSLLNPSSVQALHPSSPSLPFTSLLLSPTPAQAQAPHPSSPSLPLISPSQPLSNSLSQTNKEGDRPVVVRRSHLAAALARVKQRTATEVGAPQVSPFPFVCLRKP